VSVLEIVVVAIIATFMTIILIANLRLTLKNRSLIIKAAQAELDRITVYEQAKAIFKDEHDKSGGTDGFIKFMTKSRDWAFEYIEKVQLDLYELQTYHEKNGSAPKTVAQANELNKIILKLLDNLPKEEDKKDV